MDAVVIVDPVQYQRRRDERDDVSMPLRRLHFGPHDHGLVTLLNVLPWLQAWLNGDVDSLLNVLREVSEVPGLTGFEADIWADTVESL